MLEVAVRRQLGAFRLDAAFTAAVPGVIALFGLSGCGKTTLVDILAGLKLPDEGSVRLGGATLTDTRRGIAVPPERRGVGYVFQDGRLFPHLTVEGNLRYGLKRAGARPALIGFDEVLGLLGLAALRARRPRELSGGERQRVALGRALLAQPSLLLLDEPLAALDAPRRAEVLPYLVALRDALAIPMVYVSHDFDEVLRLATHVVLLEDGQVAADGTVEDMSLCRALQRIVGTERVGAVVEGRVTRLRPGLGGVEVALGSGLLQVSLAGVVPGDRVRLQLLARDVILATQPVANLSVRNALAGTVIALEDDVDETVLVRLDVGGVVLLARITRGAREALALRPGSTVWALVKAVSTRGQAFRLTPGA